MDTEQIGDLQSTSGVAFALIAWFQLDLET